LAILTRLSRLMHADFHAIIDSIEEPDLLLKQSIREMEASVEALQTGTRQTELDIEQLVIRLERTKELNTRYQQDLDICFDSSDEVLAKTIIRKKMENQRVQSCLDDKLERLRNEFSTLNNRFNDSQDRLEALKQRAELVLNTKASERDPAACTSDSENSYSGQATVTSQEIEIEFLREKSLRSTGTGAEQ